VSLMGRKGCDMFVRPTWAEIDLDKIGHNVEQVVALLPAGTQLMAVVKANGYGHGAILVAKKALQVGADYLAVASVDEGIELREAGIDAPILVLGYTPGEHAEVVVKWGLTQTVYQQDLLDNLSTAAVRLGRTVKVHVKLDTGMGRLGLTEVAEAVAYVERAVALPGIEVEGIYSHFATADEADETYTREQIVRWNERIAAIRARGLTVPLQHISNSAAILQYPECAESVTANMVRLGISMYGCAPSDECTLRGVELRQVLRLVSKIAHVKIVPPGTKISYGATYVTAQPTRIATVPIGYADGYSRQHSNNGDVLVRGQRCPVVGRVCMDQIMIDVTAIPDAVVGDEVVLYGGQGRAFISLDEVGARMGTISYEVSCLLGRRVPRRYLENGKVVATLLMS